MKLKTAGCFLFGLTVLASSALAQATGDPYKELPKRGYGTEIEALQAIDKEIQDAKGDQVAAIEAKLIAVLESPEATMPAKQYACQAIKAVASVKCVPAAAKLLTDEKLSHSARFVLACITDPAAGEAMVKALGQTKGNVQIGIVNTLGDRAEAASVAPLAALIATDPALNQAVLNALGKIGQAAGADALDKAKVPDCCKDAWACAYLRCADSLVAADAARADKMYRSLLDGASPPAVKSGAFLAIVKAQKEQAVPMIIKALSSDDKIMRRTAISAVLALKGPQAGAAFLKELAALSPEVKITLITALAARGEAEGISETMNQLAADKDEAVRLAAIVALERLGNAGSVAVLVASIGNPAAVTTLTKLEGAGVVDALVKQAESGDVAVRVAMLAILAERKQAEALPMVRKTAADSDAKVRKAAIKTLGVLAVDEDLPKLVDMILACKDSGEQELLARALASAGARSADKDKRSDSVIAGLAKADDASRLQLITVLAAMGGEKALATMRTYLAGEGEIKKAVIRNLAEWPDEKPLADLLNAAKTDKDNVIKILALRGYIRLTGLSKIDPKAKLKAYAEATPLITRPEEKKLLLSGLSEVQHTDALKAVQPLLDDSAVKNEAYMAYEKIAESLIKGKAKEAKAALTLVAEQAPDAHTKNKAKAALGKIK